MKRFWKDVAVEDLGNGWRVLLDGRPVSLPVPAAWLGSERSFQAYAGARDEALADGDTPAEAQAAYEAQMSLWGCLMGGGTSGDPRRGLDAWRADRQL